MVCNDQYVVNRPLSRRLKLPWNVLSRKPPRN